MPTEEEKQVTFQYKGGNSSIEPYMYDVSDSQLTVNKQTNKKACTFIYVDFLFHQTIHLV